MKYERVFITGCGGMLGNAVYPYFSSLYKNVLASDKVVSEKWLEQLDIRDDVNLNRFFKEYKPDLVLHLAAETDLEYCEQNPDVAEDVNAKATKTIAQLAQQYGSTMVYISTAGVFDGKKEGFYTEKDQPNPIMVYGKTKYQGELHTLQNCEKSFVVRAGWMMGGGVRKEKKFIYKILQQIKEGRDTIYAVSDKWGTPTYTYDFAKNLEVLVQKPNYGTYHMVCEGKGNRYHVAKQIINVCQMPNIKLVAVDSDFFKEEYFAPRPFSEMMINENLNRLGMNLMKPWEQALESYLFEHFSDYISSSRAPIGIKDVKGSWKTSNVVRVSQRGKS